MTTDQRHRPSPSRIPFSSLDCRLIERGIFPHNNIGAHASSLILDATSVPITLAVRVDQEMRDAK